MSADRVARLTANAMLHPEEAVKTQLEDWLEKPQRHEWLAVGDVASRYDAKTRMAHDCSGDALSRAVPAGATVTLMDGKPDMDNHLENLQGHEWLVVGDVACPVRTETKTTPEENRGDFKRRMLAGLLGSTVEGKGHKLEDGSDKPQEYEILALREYRSRSPAQVDEFFADIHEILGGKTE